MVSIWKVRREFEIKQVSMRVLLAHTTMRKQMHLLVCKSMMFRTKRLFAKVMQQFKKTVADSRYDKDVAIVADL